MIKVSWLAVSACAFLMGQPLPSDAQQAASARVNVRDGVTDAQLADAGFPKNPALSKLLQKHRFRAVPDKDWISELVGFAGTEGRAPDLSWGNVVKWRDCKGEGTYHAATLSQSGSASLTKTLAQVVRSHGVFLSRTEYGKLIGQFGQPRLASERMHDGSMRTTNLNNLHKVDEIYYRVNFDGRPLGVTFSINGECLNMRATWEDSIRVRTQVSDKVGDALR